jgi:hypothetical protein
MRLIAFIVDGHEVSKILEYIGVDADPPRITRARGPPLWNEGDAQASDDIETEPDWEPSVQLEPDYQYDQRISWYVR